MEDYGALPGKSVDVLFRLGGHSSVSAVFKVQAEQSAQQDTPLLSDRRVKEILDAWPFARLEALLEAITLRRETTE